MKIYFDVKNQIITRTDRNQVIANSADYLEAEITFSEDWTGYEKTMTFKNGNLLYTYVLANDKILEENHLNLGVGTWKVSIQGVNDGKKIVTNECNLAVNASGWIGSEALPPESIWNQLLVIIQSLHTEVASTAAIRSAVQKYIEDNYDALVKEAVIVDDVRAALDDMAEDGTLSDLLAPLVAAGMPEVVADQISAVVAAQIGGVVANQIGAVVASQITTPVNQAVKNYCDDNFSGWSGALDRGLAQPLMAAPADMVGAIKSALTSLNSDIDLIGTKGTPCIIDESTDFLNGYLNTSDGSFVPTSNTQLTTDFVEVEQDTTYNCDCSVTSGGTTQTYPRAICLYKSDKSFSRNLTLPAGIPFTVASNEYYIRLNYNGTLNSLAVYPASEGKESYYQLKDTTRLPADYVANVDKRIELAKFNYVHARRPIISFILDGDYDLNPTMEAIFASHGYCIGFAPQYKTFYYLPTNQAVLDKYLAWQKKGHEVLAHLQYILNDQTTYTDAEAKQIIKDSYTIMTGVGLNVKGAIGSSGKVADRFIPTIQKYYDYSATELNHGGTPTAELPAVLSFLDDNPYHLWRYSLQNSSPQQMQDAVDACIADNGLLVFYGHAQSTNTDYFTAENLETLLTYIDGKVSNLDCTVQTPYDAIRDFYSIRYDDVIPSN